MDPENQFHTGFMPQGIGADLIATLDGFSRKDVDRFAFGLSTKSCPCQSSDSFQRSIIPITDQNGIIILAEDEFIRPDTTLRASAH